MEQIIAQLIDSYGLAGGAVVVCLYLLREMNRKLDSLLLANERAYGALHLALGEKIKEVTKDGNP